MWKFQLTRFGDCYREKILFREDQKDQLTNMITRFTNRGIKFKLEVL